MIFYLDYEETDFPGRFNEPEQLASFGQEGKNMVKESRFLRFPTYESDTCKVRRRLRGGDEAS